MRFIIYGYYGFKNLGDEAILQKIITDIKNNVQDSQITVLSVNPSYTRRNFKVNSIHSLMHFDFSIFKNFFRLLREMIRCDFFILGGGGGLGDWQRSGPFILLTLPIISILLKKKLILYSVGINSFQTIYGRFLFKFVIKRSSLIIVRDIYSKICIINATGIKSKIYVTIDPAIAIEPVHNNFFKNFLKRKVNEISIKKPNIGICPSAFFHIPKLWPNSFQRFNRLKEDFRKLIKLLIDLYNANIFLIPFDLNYDLPLIKDIYDSLEKNSKLVTFIIDGIKTPNQLINSLSNMDFIIAMRFHSIVFSISLTKPFVGIIYGKKSRSLLNKINYIENSITISDGVNELNSDMDLNKIKQIISNVWHNKEEIKKFLLIKKKEMLNIEKKNIEFLKKLVNTD